MEKSELMVFCSYGLWVKADQYPVHISASLASSPAHIHVHPLVPMVHTI